MVKDIVLSSLGFSVGVALVSAAVHAKGLLEEHWRVWFVLSRAGYAVAFGLLLEALFKAPVIPPAWRTWVFVIGCVCTAVGFIGVAIHDHKRRPNGKDRRVRGRFL